MFRHLVCATFAVLLEPQAAGAISPMNCAKLNRLKLNCPKLIAALLFAMAYAANVAIAADKNDDPPCESVASIGVAHMDADGVITMRLRSLPPGPIAEGEFRYEPGDPHYQEIVLHLGGIKPGETKPVPPWC
jgi:hypothetical protein